MLLMHNLGGIFRAQQDGLVMTFQTFPFGDMAVSLNNAEMTLLTGDPSGNVLPVVKAPTFDLDVALRLDMAGRTSSHGA